MNTEFKNVEYKEGLDDGRLSVAQHFIKLSDKGIGDADFRRTVIEHCWTIIRNHWNMFKEEE